jgi:arylsulfatase
LTGGWSLYTKEGRLAYCYNFYGLDRYMVRSDTPVPPGHHQVRMEFDYDGGGIAKGGAVTLFVDGEPVGQGRVEQTEPFVFSADETCDVGDEFGSAVTDDYPVVRRFNGTIDWVEIDVAAGAADADHYISPEQRLRLVVGLQ